MLTSPESLSKLAIREGRQTIPLPEWAQFLSHLGGKMWSAAEFENARTVCSVSIPTRMYAAVFAAAGAIVEEYAFGATKGNAAFTFNDIANLAQNPLDPVVRYRISGARNWVIGDVQGYSPCDEEDALLIEDSGGCRTWITQKNFSKYEFQVTYSRRLPRETPVASSPLWSAILGTAATGPFFIKNSHSTAIVGTEGWLVQESANISFTDATQPHGEEISLRDVIRPQSMFRAGWHSQIFAPRKKQKIKPGRFTLAVFDGVEAFSRMRNNFRSSAWLVVLDRSNKSFEAGYDLIRNLYESRGGDLPDEFSPGIPPLGVEVLSHTR